MPNKDLHPSPASTRRLRWLLLCAVGCLTTLAGCGKSEPARFRLNMLEMKAGGISKDHQVQIASVLEAMFGTPDKPYALPESGLDLSKLQLAAGPAYSEEEGTAHGLFRRHCVHCHGISGDGAGPTAVFLNPYPRDYRRGIFKFKSTERAAPPTRHDLLQTLMNGIPGTAMPSFRVLPEKELDALVEYVRYLSMRGQMELALMDYVSFELNEGDTIPADRGLLIDEYFEPIATKWRDAEQQRINVVQTGAPSADRTPEEKLAAIERGRELFYGATAACSSCHGPTALGDGQTDIYDDWSTKINTIERDHPDIDPASLGVLPVRKIRPRNLRQNVFRGGRRPVDLYYRIYAGINGTPMPAATLAAPGAEKGITAEQIWDIVEYVKSMPYEDINMPSKELLNLRERN